MKKLISLLSLPVFLSVLLPQVAFAYSGVNLANVEPDAVYTYNASAPIGSRYTNETTDAQDYGIGSADLNINTDLDDNTYFGFSEMFDGVAVNIYTSVQGYADSDLGTGPDGTYVFEYWNGAWTELEINEDNLLGWNSYDIEDDATSGVFAKTWQRPTDWTTVSVSSSSAMYYVRMRIDEEYSSSTTATAVQVGIIDYNLKVEVLDELGYAIEGMEELDFELAETSGGDDTIYSFEDLGDGLYGFAIDPSFGSAYELSLYPSGFAAEDRAVTLDLGESLYDDFDMAYSHLLMAESEAGIEVGIEEATAGVTPVDCVIDGMEAYCAVDISNDGTGAEAYVYADGYVALTDGITNRTSSTLTQQAQENYVLEYGYVATVKDESGNLLTTATVKAGDDLTLTCDYLGSGRYGCPISLSDSEPLVEISLTGYETLESVFSSERTAPASAQVETTFRLTEATTEEPDPSPETADDTDTDGDGLTDVEEDILGTDENDTDSDNDGLDDGDEVDEETDPKDSDSDSDDLEDGEEMDLGTDPNDSDTDNDGDEDGDEVDAGTDPLVDEAEVTESDSDGDGLDDDDEADLGTDENDVDSDDDGISDGAEVATDTDPLDREDFLANAEDYDADCDDPFTDTAGNFAEISICLLYDDEIVNGATASTYEPSRAITRAEFLKIALLNAGLTVTADTSVSYDDVDSSDWYYSYITYATAEGYVEGYDDGDFRPNEEINRAEAMVMMLRIAGVEEGDVTMEDASDFSDVEDDDWFAWAVVEAESEGISEGYSDGTFKPGNDITRAEVAVIARRVWYVYFE